MFAMNKDNPRGEEGVRLSKEGGKSVELILEDSQRVVERHRRLQRQLKRNLLCREKFCKVMK